MCTVSFEDFHPSVIITLP